MERRLTGSMVLALSSVWMLSACLPPEIACSAIGYISSVEVQLDSDVAQLEACVDSVCSSPSSQLGTVTVQEIVPGTWTVDFLTGPPEELTLRALDGSGMLLGEETFPLEWERVGGSEQCGGPMETSPLRFVR